MHARCPAAPTLACLNHPPFPGLRHRPSFPHCRIDVINREDALTFLESEERRAAAAQRAAHAEAAAAAARRSKGKAPLVAPPEEEEGEVDAMEED